MIGSTPYLALSGGCSAGYGRSRFSSQAHPRILSREKQSRPVCVFKHQGPTVHSRSRSPAPPVSRSAISQRHWVARDLLESVNVSSASPILLNSLIDRQPALNESASNDPFSLPNDEIAQRK